MCSSSYASACVVEVDDICGLVCLKERERQKESKKKRMTEWMSVDEADSFKGRNKTNAIKPTRRQRKAS